MTDLARNKELVRQYLKAVEAKDVEQLGELLADDLEYWVAGSLPLSGTHGKSLILKAFQAPESRNAVVEITQTPVTFTAEGDRVAVEVEGTSRTAAGEPYNNQYHYLFEFRDGKIVQIREYMDTALVASVGLGMTRPTVD